MAHPALPQARFAASDPRLDQLFAAGVETFRQNALDLFMDCPSRERAGWLCDSFFTARTAGDLAGTPLVERNFFENFLLPKSFPHLPEGMLPMCYPADHNDGVFIPNWAMWFVVELEEYAARSGDRVMAEPCGRGFCGCWNTCGASRTPTACWRSCKGWVFVEWSAANRFVQDVNYPIEHALRGGPRRRPRGSTSCPSWPPRATASARRSASNRSTGIFSSTTPFAATASSNRPITTAKSASISPSSSTWPTARPTATYGPAPRSVRPRQRGRPCLSRSVPGQLVRRQHVADRALVAGQLSQQILDESIAYLLYMAERTGTLWENTGPSASCNHGFGSHIVHTLYRDVLGIYAVDPVRKTVQLRLGDLKLDWCQGSRPTPEGSIELSWRKDGERLLYRLSVPAGYRVSIENCSGLELLEEPAKK